MGKEIERKFRVAGSFKAQAYHSFQVKQGYLSSLPERTVRIRVKEGRGYITIKGKSNPSGVSRFEWEREISLDDAEELMQLCEPGVVEKTRYLVRSGNHIFEVDEFGGENEGLVLAEVELRDERESFVKPEWLGEEVTGRKEYYNTMLVKYPFKQWKK